ncbi:MAG: hypothetical protein JNG88_03995 [Phycisphaerales bacterium]|nr:hypothetical protein [Phycisphaerales bacterium]
MRIASNPERLTAATKRESRSKNASPPAARFVRYESREGVGLFHILHEFDWIVGDLSKPQYRSVKIPKARAREIFLLHSWLHGHTTAPPRTAYDDRLSRSPITWFRSTATEHLRRADRLCDLLRLEGLDIRRIERMQVRGVLWSDDETVVTRRERGPDDAWATKFVRAWLSSRQRDRRVKQKRRRQSAANRKARELKSGL